MNTEKLFKVLVLGGSVLVAAEAMSDEVSIKSFCSPDDETTCVEDETGQMTEREGVVCCWGTTCNEE